MQSLSDVRLPILSGTYDFSLQMESKLTMIKAYLILAHKYPAQLRRLIKALDDGRSFFYIHIDRNADLAQFDNLQPWADKINYIKRESGEWAGYGLVHAMINGLKAIGESKQPFGHVILLSGQDYPVKSNDQIHQFLEQNAGVSFMEHHRLPAPSRWPNNGGLYRVNKYYIGIKPWQLFCSKSLNFLARPLPFLKRRIYANMEPFAGSMWWILSMQAVRYVLSFISNNPGYVSFHRFTFAADEVFFQTILLNEPATSEAGKIVNDDRRFIKWQNINASHPEILGIEYIDEALQSNALFARKFDTLVDDHPLDKIDAHRLHPTNMYASSL